MLKSPLFHAFLLFLLLYQSAFGPPHPVVLSFMEEVHQTKRRK